MGEKKIPPDQIFASKPFFLICSESDGIRNLQHVRSGIDRLIATFESLSRHEIRVKFKGIRDLPQHNTYAHNFCRKLLLHQARNKNKLENQSSSSKVPAKRKLSNVRQIERNLE